jgi:pimeloyl-ACP methyl ester carboxylesterase
MANLLKNTLFLHWGPGGCCEVERKWFGESNPVSWWDQPLFGQEAPGAWPKLVEAATIELDRLAQASGPVSLIGHSFGGQLALELSHRRPDLIRDITLVNAGEWPPRMFLALASRMKSEGLGGAALEQALAAARAKLGLDTFWGLLGQITAVPDFMDLYWGPESGPCKEKYFSLATPERIVNLPTFSSVMNSFFPAKRPEAASPFTGSVRLIAGSYDPLMQTEQELAAWKAHFPRIAGRTLACGHFAQFEAGLEAILEPARA